MQYPKLHKQACLDKAVGGRKAPVVGRAQDVLPGLVARTAQHIDHGRPEALLRIAGVAADAPQAAKVDGPHLRVPEESLRDDGHQPQRIDAAVRKEQQARKWSAVCSELFVLFLLWAGSGDWTRMQQVQAAPRRRWCSRTCSTGTV